MLVQGGQRLPGHLSRQLCYPSLSRVHFLGSRCLRHVSLRRSDNPTPRFPPPGSHGLGSPASTVLSGRYDFLPFLPPRFVALTPAVPSRALAFRPFRGRALPRAVFWSWSPGISGRAIVDGNDRISYVPGEPRLCSCPALRPRQDRRHQACCDAPARPPQRPRQRLLHE